MRLIRRLTAAALLCPVATGGLAQAQTGAPAIALELNLLEPVEAGCRAVFVAENPGDEDIDALVLEAVLFDRDGRVAQLTLLDLQELPAGRMRVRSFDLAGLDCAGIGRLLVNDLSCLPEGAAICGRALGLSTRMDLDLRQ